jgi:hypothetical protein
MSTAPELPTYWHPRPALELDAATRAGFDAVLDAALAAGPAQPIDYHLAAPKWQFLCYLAEECGYALHGSLNPHITEFEPRQPIDLRAFGAQLAVYAAADGIWPMFFAIVDRERYPTSIINGCIRVQTPDGTVSPPHYVFSVGRHVIDQRPYRDGAVYLLPRDNFMVEPPIPFGPLLVHTAQLASLEPVRPLAKLAITPDDFPFLAQMLAHDDHRLAVYAEAMQQGAPWPSEKPSAPGG